MLSKTELVEAFVEASIRGQDTLLANKQFLAENRFGTNQLIDKQAGLSIKVDVKQQPIQFWVRRDTSDYDWIQALLKQHQFFESGTQGEDGFCSYQYVAAKDGYTLNRQSARALWKNWRSLYRMHENMAKAQKLLIKGGHDWEQVKKMTVSNNLLFVETPEGETTYNMDDAIAWLSEIPKTEPTQAVDAASDVGGFAADGFLD